MFFKSLISRVIILNVLLLTIGIGTFTLFHLRREQHHLISSTRQSAELLLETVEKSIFNSMRMGNSADVQAVLEMIGRNSSLANVRIFAPDGTILRSARPQEIGQQVNPRDRALFENNHREAIFRVDGEEVVGIIKPIVADERCYFCHGVGKKVIGVLNLNYSLTDTIAKLQASTRFFAFSTVVMIILLSGGGAFILLRLVKRPMIIVGHKMAQVAGGDLSVRTYPRSGDEVGSLMHSFNSMVKNLQEAQQELERYHYQQMERADRLASVGEMATGIAHEIKNPLAGISGAVSVLADDLAEDDPRREIIRQVLEQIARLNKTATDLLFFGRPGKPEFTYVDLNELVRKTLFFVSQHPEARNVHRTEELAEDLPPVWIDEKQIQQVLFNVILNAIQAMPGGGTLLVATDAVRHENRPFGRVKIADTGRGIPAEELDKIFVPFFTTKTQGTGLGLPICRQLVEQHGGSIRVESQPGEGSVFFIEFPVTASPAIDVEEDDSAPT